METTLTSTIKNISPILYDLTVTPLPEDPVEPLKEADLITSISTDNYTPQINDTIKIIINVGNNGPNNASNVKVTYKLPFGMEYLTTNGNYDPITGLWTIGNLDSGSSASLEILAKILNTGNLVNIETVTGLEYDPISANNQAKLTLNIPYLDPENQIPEVPSNLPDNGTATLPPIPNIENLIDLDIHQPGTNPIPPNNPPNPPKPDTPDPNPPGPNPPSPPDKPGPNPPNPGPNPNSSPGTWGGNDQLYRDQMYIRDTLSYVPTTDPDTNTTTTPPEMPEWKISTDIITEILIATAMLATSAVAARFLNGNVEEMRNSFGKWAVKHLGHKEPSIASMILYVLSIGLFALDPGLVDGILLFVGMFGFFFNFIVAIMYSGAMDIFGYFLLAVAIIKLVEKIWGYDVVQMASDKLGKLKEIFTNEFGPIFDRLKEMFGLK